MHYHVCNNLLLIAIRVNNTPIEYIILLYCFFLFNISLRNERKSENKKIYNIKEDTIMFL